MVYTHICIRTDEFRTRYRHEFRCCSETMIFVTRARVRVVYLNARTHAKLGSLIERRFNASLFDNACFNTNEIYMPPGDFNYMYGYSSERDNERKWIWIFEPTGNFLDRCVHKRVPRERKFHGKRETPWHRSYISRLISNADAGQIRFDSTRDSFRAKRKIPYE